VWNLDIIAKPFFLGGIMKGSGNTPPAQRNQSNAIYIINDVKRNQSLFEMKILNSPTNFFSEVAKKVLIIQRVLIGLKMDDVCKDEAVYHKVITDFFNSVHSNQKYRNDNNDLIINDEMIIEILMKSTGMPLENAKRSLKRINDQDVKDKLQQNTQDALDMNCFGAPSFVIEKSNETRNEFFNEENNFKVMIFGSDRMEQIALLLNKKYNGVINNLNHPKL